MDDFNKVEEALYELEDYISAPEAVKLTGISKPTLIKWAGPPPRGYSLGRKVGGRWFLHQEKLAMMLRGIARRDGRE
jgi:hypothetical protein